MIPRPSLYRQKPASKPQRRVVTQQDLFVYEAIVGQRVEDVMASDGDAAATDGAPSDDTATAALGRQSSMNAQSLGSRLRGIIEGALNHAHPSPNAGRWLRHLSENALRRIEQAQARLNASRSSRQAISKTPKAPESHVQNGHYKQVA